MCEYTTPIYIFSIASEIVRVFYVSRFFFFSLSCGVVHKKQEQQEQQHQEQQHQEQQHQEQQHQERQHNNHQGPDTNTAIAIFFAVFLFISLFYWKPERQ